MDYELKTELVRSLRYLAGGGQPHEPYNGVCDNAYYGVMGVVRDRTPRSEVLGALGEVFEGLEGLGGHHRYPVAGLDEYLYVNDLWVGLNGACRRLLAQICADVIEHGKAYTPDVLRFKAMRERLQQWCGLWLPRED